MTDEPDELLDLVNERDEVVGSVMRSQTSGPEFAGFLRASDAFIINSRGQFWIPRRQAHKTIAPGGLDYSMGEHVKAGESYLKGCLRGFREELNLNLKEADLHLIRKFEPLKHVRYFRSLYIYRSDKSPSYNTHDFSGYQWLSPKELIDAINRGDKAKNSLLETATYLLRQPNI